jgi:hypothetical protein
MTNDGAGREPGDFSTAPLHRLLEIATSGEWLDRIDLADAEGLPAEVYGALKNDEAREVIVLLARNRFTPRDLLEDLASRDSELSDLVDLNPNADPSRKDRVATWKHTQVSLERYFDEVGCTVGVREFITRAWLDRDSRTLGDLRGSAEPAGQGSAS